MIYKEAFPSRTITDIYRLGCTVDYPKFAITAYKWKTNADKTSRDLVHKQFPRWVAPNRQFLTEAIHAFARNKVFEVKCRIDDLSEDEEEEKEEGKGKGKKERDEEDAEEIPMLQRLILIQAISSIKVGYIANRGPSSPDPGSLHLSAEDAEALSAFRDLRKGNLPPDLVLEWRYDVHAHSSSSDPRFVSRVLQGWQHSFRRVTVTTTTSDNRDRPVLPVQKQSKRNDEGPQHSVQDTPIINIRNRLRQEAEKCARQLVRSNGCGVTRVWLSVEKSFVHGMEINMYFQTVEAVDWATMGATPLAVFDERYRAET